MPTYVYRCEQGHTFELFHSIADESTKHCPECGAEAKRVPAGGAGFLFKGSGFYITDYRNKDSAAKEKRAGTGESKPAESKPAEAKSSAGEKPAAEAKAAPAKAAAPSSEKKSSSSQK